MITRVGSCNLAQASFPQIASHFAPFVLWEPAPPLLPVMIPRENVQLLKHHFIHCIHIIIGLKSYSLRILVLHLGVFFSCPFFPLVWFRASVFETNLWDFSHYRESWSSRPKLKCGVVGRPLDFCSLCLDPGQTPGSDELCFLLKASSSSCCCCDPHHRLNHNLSLSVAFNS